MVQSSVKVPEFDKKRLRNAGGHIIQNINITIKNEDNSPKTLDDKIKCKIDFLNFKVPS